MNKIKLDKNQFNNFKINEALEEDGKMIIRGIACDYNTVTRNKTKYEKVTFIEKLPALFNHDHNIIIGNVTFKEYNAKVYFEIQLNKNLDKAQEVWEQVKHGDLTGVSIGALIKEWTYDEEEDIYIIKQAELIELSIVTVPSNPNARIQTIENLNTEELELKETEKKTKKKEEKMNEYKKMNLVNLNEEIDNMTSKTNKLTENIDKLTLQITENKGDDKLNGFVKEKEEMVKTLESINSELEEAKKERAVKQHQLNEIKEQNKAMQSLKLEEKGEEMPNNTNSKVTGLKDFLKTERSKELFIESLVETVQNAGSKLKDVYSKHLRNEGFTGDLDALFPKGVIQDINETMESFPSILPFVKRITGVTSFPFVINKSEELGWGHTPGKDKQEQNNELVSFEILSQYIYKYVTVSREQLDQPSNVLYDYVIQELSERLIMTLEKAILIDDGLPALDTKKITKIVPMTKYDGSAADDIFGTSITLNALTADTLDDLDTEINDNGMRTVYVMSKRTYKKLKNIRGTTNENRVYEIGTEKVAGQIYDTLDGNIIVKTKWLPDFDTATAGSYPIIAFKVNSYDLITYQTNAEMFMDFKLDSNTNQFLTEIRAGGDVVKPRSIALGKK